MKSIVAIALIVLGTLVFAYSGFHFTTPGESFGFLGLSIETEESHFIPPVAGLIAIIGGIVLLVFKPNTAR